MGNSAAKSKERFQPTRIFLGVFGGIFLVLGAWLTLGDFDINDIWAGGFVRVGAMLSVTCLAYPSLHTLKSKSSMAVIAILVGLLVVLAARPRLFPIAFIASIVLLLANGILHRLASSMK